MDLVADVTISSTKLLYDICSVGGIKIINSISAQINAGSGGTTDEATGVGVSISLLYCFLFAGLVSKLDLLANSATIIRINFLASISFTFEEVFQSSPGPVLPSRR